MKYRLGILLFCVFTLETQAEEIQLSPIDVRDTALNQGSPSAPSLPKAQHKALTTAGAVSVLDAERYRNGRAAGQDDVFKLVPGVFVQSDNAADDARISIRGSGLSSRSFGRGISSFQDGIPLGRLDSGTTAQLVDVLAYDYVEVLRGANGLVLGSSSLGGAINYHSKTGHSAAPFTGRLTLGEDGFTNTQVSTGQVVGAADYFVSLSHLKSDGFRDNQENENLRLNANFGYQINENIENRTYLIVADANAELAGTVLKENLRQQREDAGVNNLAFNTDRNWRDVSIANKTSLLNDNKKLELFIAASKTALDHLPTPFTGIIDDEYRQTRAGIKFSVAHDNNDLTLGVRIGHQDSDELRFRHLNGGQDKGALVHDATLKINDVEFFADNEYRLSERWAVLSGFNYLESKRDYQDNITTSLLADVVSFRPPFPDPQPNQRDGDQSFNLTYRGFSPKLGLRFSWAEEQYAFANISQSLGLPSGSEMNTRTAEGLAELDEQVATTIEIGAKGRSDSLSWEVTYYLSEIDDELLDVTSATTDQLVISNFDETRHQGLETGVEWLAGSNLLEQGDSLIWSAVYNWSDFTIEKFSGDPSLEGNRIPRTPEHVAYAEAEYTMANGLSITPNVRYVGSYETTYDNSGGNAFDVDSYSLLGLKLNYDVGNGLSAFIDIRNLEDKVHAVDATPTSSVCERSCASSASVTPGQGRTAYIGIQYQM